MEEEKKPDLFFAMFPDGNCSGRSSLQEAVSIPNVEFVLVGKYGYTYHGYVNHTSWYHWNLQDLQGNPTTLRRGYFELNAVDVDNGCTRFFGRNVIIRDCKRGTFHKFKSDTEGAMFIKKDILPLLNALNEVGSWDTYELLKQQKEEIERLKYCNERLEKKIETLKAQQVQKEE